MRKSLILLVVGAAIALAVMGPLLLKQQAEARRLGVERDHLKTTLGAAEKRALDAEDRLDRQNGELERLRRGQEELLRLRGEVTQLRQAGADALAAAARRPPPTPKPATAEMPPQPPVAEPTPAPDESEPFGIGVFMRADQCNFAGFNSPRDVLETLQWALRTGETDTINEVFLPVEVPAGDPSVVVGGPDTLTAADGSVGVEPGDSVTTVTTEVATPGEWSGYIVVGGMEAGPDEVRLMVRNQRADGSQEDLPMTFHRVGTGWKIAPTVVPVSATVNPDAGTP
ncbi:MAG: hypothetical protein H7A46_02015 [Verrucomicrobiales bacterium]|nr:hypothetical protein [Verrucomicrobiales bacterium]